MLNGNETFHLMGIIKSAIKKEGFEHKPVKRTKHILKRGEVTEKRQIKIQRYWFPDQWLLAKMLLRSVSSVAAKSPTASSA